MINKLISTKFVLSLLAIYFVFPACPVIGQISVVKTIPNAIENIYGSDFIKVGTDSLLLLSIIRDNQNKSIGNEILNWTLT